MRATLLRARHTPLVSFFVTTRGAYARSPRAHRTSSPRAALWIPAPSAAPRTPSPAPAAHLIACFFHQFLRSMAYIPTAGPPAGSLDARHRKRTIPQAPLEKRIDDALRLARHEGDDSNPVCLKDRVYRPGDRAADEQVDANLGQAKRPLLGCEPFERLLSLGLHLTRLDAEQPDLADDVEDRRDPALPCCERHSHRD